jgi:hypothetical protein
MNCVTFIEFPNMFCSIDIYYIFIHEQVTEKAKKTKKLEKLLISQQYCIETNRMTKSTILHTVYNL